MIQVAPRWAWAGRARRSGSGLHLPWPRSQFKKKKKMIQRPYSHLTKKDIDMANWHLKRCPTSYVIR